MQETFLIISCFVFFALVLSIFSWELVLEFEFELFELETYYFSSSSIVTSWI